MNPQEQKKLENKILEKLRPLKKVILGLSGGPDSIFLLHFLQKAKIPTIAAHLNHQIRPEATKEQEFVQKIYSQTLIKSVDIPCLAKKLKKGLEESGRIERYKFFNELADSHKATHILTAHHADDNIESILLNLTRGASLQGLTGMPQQEGLLYRPLLQISKQEITNYLDTKEIPYIKDPSNNDTKFRRNSIRHKVIPVLRKHNPNIAKTIAKNTQNIAEITEFLDQLADSWILKNCNTPNQLNAKIFRETPLPLQKILLRKIYTELTGDTKNLESTHITEILDLIKNNVGNKKKTFGKLKISLKSNIVRLEREQ